MERRELRPKGIEKLSDDVIDQIAAGEVVERPAHMVKELVENSLDSLADKITLEISEGGRNLEILDNGKGVLKEDLPKVFQRHATSKISNPDDLWSLNSFGFRGEALASIGSVAEVEFSSRPIDFKKAEGVRCEYGSIKEIPSLSMSQGTRIRITNLFENTPVRKKFLKTDSAEISQIRNVLKSFALCHPKVEFKIKVNGKLDSVWSPCESRRQRAEDILGCTLYDTFGEYDGYRSEIIFSDPANVKKTSRQMWYFVEDRWIQDKGLQAAVLEAYRNLLMHGQYPICCVFIKGAPGTIDVNVHPSKSQVKFLDQKASFRSVHRPLRAALEKTPWQVVDDTKGRFEPIVGEKQGVNPRLNSEAHSVEDNNDVRDWKDQKTVVSSSSSDLNNLVLSPSEGGDSVQQGHLQGREFQRVQYSQKTMASSQDHDSDTDSLDARKRSPIDGIGDSPSISKDSSSEERPNYWSQFQVIGQVDLTYIVAQSAERLILVDQHAAHERVAFERLMEKWRKGEFELQNLLIPLEIDLAEDEVEVIFDRHQEIQSLGVELERTGPASLRLTAHSSLVSEGGVVKALRKYVSQVQKQGDSFAIHSVITEIFESMACHSVVRAGQSLSREQMENLLKDMDEFPLSGFCPHGRSVSVDWSFAHLEKLFGRRV